MHPCGRHMVTDFLIPIWLVLLSPTGRCYSSYSIGLTLEHSIVRTDSPPSSSITPSDLPPRLDTFFPPPPDLRNFRSYSNNSKISLPICSELVYDYIWLALTYTHYRSMVPGDSFPHQRHCDTHHEPHSLANSYRPTSS
jgi:hypothetical protein